MASKYFAYQVSVYSVQKEWKMERVKRNNSVSTVYSCVTVGLLKVVKVKILSNRVLEH